MTSPSHDEPQTVKYFRDGIRFKLPTGDGGFAYVFQTWDELSKARAINIVHPEWFALMLMALPYYKDDTLGGNYAKTITEKPESSIVSDSV